MAQQIQKTEIDRGQPVQLNFTMTPPTNIAGWALRFTLAEDRNLAAKLWQSDALTVVDANVGTFHIVVPGEQTNRTPKSYWFDVWRVDAGEERLLAIGYLSVQPVVRLP